MKAKYSAFSATKKMHGSSGSFSVPGFQKQVYVFLPLVFLLALIIGAYALRTIPPAIFWIYLVMSVVAFVVYGMDKYKATSGKWRIKEATLHLLELLCGWPGAMLAQVFIRHKNAKPSFQLVFWAMLAINLGLFAFFIFR